MIEAHLCTESDVAFAPHLLFESNESGACFFESRLDLRLEWCVWWGLEHYFGLLDADGESETLTRSCKRINEPCKHSSE